MHRRFSEKGTFGAIVFVKLWSAQGAREQRIRLCCYQNYYCYYWGTPQDFFAFHTAPFWPVQPKRRKAVNIGRADREGAVQTGTVLRQKGLEGHDVASGARLGGANAPETPLLICQPNADLRI